MQLPRQLELVSRLASIINNCSLQQQQQQEQTLLCCSLVHCRVLMPSMRRFHWRNINPSTQQAKQMPNGRRQSSSVSIVCSQWSRQLQLDSGKWKMAAAATTVFLPLNLITSISNQFCRLKCFEFMIRRDSRVFIIPA